MARTEFHSKLEEQIEAIESVAKETKGVATAITDREERPNADSVIALATDLMVKHCVGNATPVDVIEFNQLSEGDPRTAFEELKFNNEKLRALYDVICPSAPPTSAPQTAPRTTPPEPKSPPPTSPPRGKGSAKKR